MQRTEKVVLTLLGVLNKFVKGIDKPKTTHYLHDNQLYMEVVIYGMSKYV